MPKTKSVFIESLESRQHLSVTTTTAVTESAKTAVLGQAFSVTAKVKPSSGSATSARGTVELLNDNKDTGITGTLNHKGYVVFNIGPGNAIFVGAYKFSARFLTAGKFVGSKSKALPFNVTVPMVTTASDGLEEGTVTAGTGAPAVSGDTLVAQYTGFLGGGSVFDESSKHTQPFSYTLNATPEDVIKGFDEGTTGMKVGETRVLVVPSALGYNDGDTRIFIVHLVSITAPT